MKNLLLLLIFNLLLLSSFSCRSKKIEQKIQPIKKDVPSGFKIIEDLQIIPVEVKEPEYKLFLSLSEITDDDEIKDLLIKLKDAGQGGYVKEKILKIGRRAYPVLIKALRAWEPNIRIQSAMILYSFGNIDEEGISAFNSVLLKDPDPDVRGNIARVMVSLKDKRSVMALIEALKNDRDEMVRAHSAYALGEIGDERAIEPLRMALKDEKTWVRLRVVSAFKKMGTKSVVKDLIPLLDDPNDMVRKRTYETLVKITGKNFGKDKKNWMRFYK